MTTSTASTIFCVGAADKGQELLGLAAGKEREALLEVTS